MRKSILSFVVIGALVVSFAACNNPEQPNFDFRTGDSLRIDGPTSITLVPDSTTTANTTDFFPADSSIYKIVYGTVDVDYKWSVTGGAKIDSTFWYEDLRSSITFPGAGTYTVKVSGTYSNGHTYKGTLDVKVKKPDEK